MMWLRSLQFDSGSLGRNQMTEASDPSSWFVKDQEGVRGPLKESEMRTAVMDSDSDSMQVRQGSGQWHSAELVRKKIEALNANGIYIKFKTVAEGPYTLTKAHQMLQSFDMDGVRVRTGSKGKWVSAKKWMAAVERLKREKKNPDVASITSGLREIAQRQSGQQDAAPSRRPNEPKRKPAETNDIPVAIPVGAPDQVPVAIPVEATIPVAIPVEATIPVAIPVEATIPVAIPIAPETPVAIPVEVEAVAVEPEVYQAQLVAPAASGFDSITQPTNVAYQPPAYLNQPAPQPTSRPEQRSSQRNQSSGSGGSVVLRIASALLTIILFFGAIGFKMIRRAGKAGIQQYQQQQADQRSSNFGPGR